MYDTARTLRNATVGDLHQMLTDQQVRKHDLVVPAHQMRAEARQFVVAGTAPTLSDDGVTVGDGRYDLTDIAIEKAAAALQVPVAYMRRMHADRPDLFDANVNGWLHGNADQGFDPDTRSFLLRTFKRTGEGDGLVRTVLSNRYGIIDHLDLLTAATKGVQDAGFDINPDNWHADLTDRRMVIRAVMPEIKALAPALLGNYRSPFTGEFGADNPTVFAGFVLSNSETGDGAWTITPRLEVQVCSNGMVIRKDALRGVHLGTKMDDGVIRWSQDTMDKQLAVVTAKAADAVRTFCDVDYMNRAIADLTAKADMPIEKVDQVQDVTKGLGFSEEHRDGVLSMFIKGGQMNRGGIMHAITAYTQTIDDADVAYEMDLQAVRVLA
jgi:hypothetical protein